MKLTHIKNGLVINISKGELEQTQQMFPDQIIRETGNEQIGNLWDGSTFSAPEEVTPVQRTTITRLAFRNRFTPAEKAALYTAAKENVQIQIYLDDVNSATFVDLSRTDTREGVIALENAGLIGSGRALEILDSPVKFNEMYT